MSEYKVTVKRSKWQFWLIKAFALLCLFSLWLWPQQVQWQWIIQLLLSVAVIYFALLPAFEPRIEAELVLSDEGEVRLLVLNKVNEVFESFVLSPTSVTSDWFCYLICVPQGLMATQHKQRIWVFRDGVDEREFRRLCRVIYRVRRGR